MKPLLDAAVSLKRSLLRGAVMVAMGILISLGTQWLTRDAKTPSAPAAAPQTADDVAQVSFGDARYRDLAARGIVGPERRDEWIRRLQANRHSADIGYRFERQQPLVLGAASPGGRYEFVASAMTLHVGVLHEEALLDFLDELRHTVPALLRVRACKLERLTQADAASNARLKADCVLDWITLQVKS